MTFATTRQMLAITVVWALALFGIDYLKNPRSLASFFSVEKLGATQSKGRQHLTLYMNHLCCSGCLSDVSEALAQIPGLKVKDLALKNSEENEKPGDTTTRYDNQVEVEVTDFHGLDFMQVDAALRRSGLVAERIEFGGPAHFRLEAKLDHLCCGGCARSINQGLEMTKALKAEKHFTWLDSVTVEKERKTVVAHALYDANVDLAELIAGLNHLGFQPASLFAVDSGERRQAAQ